MTVQRQPNIASRTDGVSTAERQDNRLDSESNRKEVFWPWICLLKVNNFRAGSVGEVRRVFEIYAERGKGSQKADGPKDHAEANRTSSLEDRGCYCNQNESALLLYSDSLLAYELSTLLFRSFCLCSRK